MRGVHPSDWFSLLRFIKYRDDLVSEYVPSLTSTTQLPRSFPWPVAWLASSYSKKHIFINKRRPSLSVLNEDLVDFVNRVKWSSVLSGTSSAMPFPKACRQTPTCTEIVEPDLGRFLWVFRRRVMRSAASISRKGSQVTSNILGLHRLAFRLLKSVPYILLPHDKQPGFAAVPIENFAQLEVDSLSSHNYEPCLPSLVDKYKSEASSMCSSLARRIEKKLEIPCLARRINASLQAGSFAAHLGLLVKNHKPPGEVSCRVLHKHPCNMLLGLSLWVNSILTPFLDRHWLLRDSFAFKDSVHNQ